MMSQFLMGAMAMACWTAALFFVRFWRDTHDRLFALFAAAFVLLGFTRMGLALWPEIGEGQTYFHWVRFAAYLIILIAIVDKNRR
jgi:hypothetical protein